jgi:hypothetical protein
VQVAACWTDNWLHGKSLDQLVPHLFNSISNQARKRRTVYETLTERKWVSDIKGAFTLDVLVEFLSLWDLLAEKVLRPVVEDSHIWCFSASGQYSAKSAYDALFIVAIHFQPDKRIWQSWAPGKCKFFLWLAAHNKCWTADQLAKRGLSHPDKCPLCDQEEETINHMLLSCVFARQIWYGILQGLHLQVLAPQMEDSSFEDWWQRVSSKVDRLVKEGLNSIIILVAWTLWNHRNHCVFDGLHPNLHALMSTIREEMRLWGSARARGVSFLLAQLPHD